VKVTRGRWGKTYAYCHKDNNYRQKHER
jgi:hypothetical protein